MLKLKFIRVFLLLSCLFFCNHLYAQPFGNEWIVPSQKYVKIKISEEGLYGIDVNQVIQAGLVTQNINPKKFQLFNKGKEVAILVTGDTDNNFDSNDKIVFYGKANDASLDKVLYNNPADLPNDEVSLFENDNYYFLTYNESRDGLRIKEFAETNNGLTEESFILSKSRVNFSDSYYPGEFILSAMSLSEYIEGEGFMSNTFAKGQSTNLNINVADIVSSSFQPQLSFYVAGRSNASSTNASGFNHHLRILLNNNIVFDTLFRGYKTVRKTLPINLTTTNNQITFSAIDDLGALTDFQAISYAEITYARGTNITNTQNLRFSLNNNKPLSYLKFRNSALLSPVLWDLTSDFMVKGIKSSTNADFIINTTNQQKNYFLADLDNLKPTSLVNVTFRNFLPTEVKPFLMVSNKLLTAGANNYKAYNDTRNIETTIAYTDDLYNEFYYGFHHPLALKNFCAWALARGNTKPEYLLLLGKGMEISKGNFSNDLVPTMGYPASDNMLTSGLNGSNLEPGLATGRVPAKTNEEVENYLGKLKIYNNLPDSIWRKKLVHISGGRSSSENLSFINYQNILYEKAKKDFFGASIVNIRKNVTEPVTENLTDRIVKETRDGAALISFLGHGSTTTTEILLGDIANLNNKNKPTFYLVNGCSTGNVFTSANSLGEQFVLQKDFGAVAWIGTTSEGVASYLNGISSNFYNNWFKNMYGESAGKSIIEGLKNYQLTTDKLNIAHVRQFIYLGDPSLKFYSPDKVDYAINNSSVYLTNPSQNANSQIIDYNVIIKNSGKAIIDSIPIQVSRTLPDRSILNYPIYKIPPIYNLDTIKLKLDNTGLQSAGNNKLSILIDPNNKLDESSKINNQSIVDFFLAGNGLNLIYPYNNGIVDTDTLTLKAQPDNLFTKTTSYIFEIDTVENFSSNFKISSGEIQAGIFPSWKPNIKLENNKVYYWRAKINSGPSEQWRNASFTYVNKEEGFMQSHKGQLSQIALINIIRENNGSLNFVPDIFSTSIQTRGDDASMADERRFRYQGLGLGYNNPESPGITIVSYNPIIYGNRFSYPSPFNFINDSGPIIGYTGQYYWDTNNVIQTDSLLRYLQQIPTGYHVIGYNGFNAAFNELPNSVKQELTNLGLNKFNQINRGEPYMFWGRKGASPGSAIEVTADYSATIPPRSQLIRNFVDLNYRFDNGSITTEKIGPSKKWIKADISFLERPQDEIKYTIIGINSTNNSEDIIFNNLTNNSIDLSSINPLTYPYIKIKAFIKNSQLRTVPKINFFKFNYEPLAEISFNPEIKNIFYKENIQEGDSIQWDIGITNLSKYNSGNLNLSYTIRKSDNTLVTKTLTPIAGLEAYKATSIKIKEGTLNFKGLNNIRLNIKQEQTGDLLEFNNSIGLNYNIQEDIKDPIINVVFDGKTIVNGEIISPEPTINITLRDENKFLMINDSSYLNIFIRKDEETNFQRVNYSSGQINLIPTSNEEENKLTLEYKPTRLRDGKYTMKVNSKDASNNSNPNDYEISFEVINESSISNFYPYPNPVTTAMKFVFTLTGEKVPDKMKIQILTISGKVIREIKKEELGTIKIGNNISDFTWDGTDMFGDRLANGVYFYKVIIEDNDGDLKHRNTKGDKFFKNKIGKIYLLK